MTKRCHIYLSIIEARAPLGQEIGYSSSRRRLSGTDTDLMFVPSTPRVQRHTVLLARVQHLELEIVETRNNFGSALQVLLLGVSAALLSFYTLTYLLAPSDQPNCAILT